MQPGAQNGVMGDDNFGINLPQSQVPEADLQEERAIAQYSQTKEFKRFKEVMESRIQHYKTLLPGEITLEQAVSLSNEQLGEQWRIANIVINEFKGVLNAYETTAEAVKDADARRELS